MRTILLLVLLALGIQAEEIAPLPDGVEPGRFVVVVVPVKDAVGGHRVLRIDSATGKVWELLAMAADPKKGFASGMFEVWTPLNEQSGSMYQHWVKRLNAGQ